MLHTEKFGAKVRKIVCEDETRDELSDEFHSFFLERFPPDSKRGTSGVFYKEFGEKVKDTIKNPSTADKDLCFYIKKNQLKLLDLPSLGARDVLIIPVKENREVRLFNG